MQKVAQISYSWDAAGPFCKQRACLSIRLGFARQANGKAIRRLNDHTGAVTGSPTNALSTCTLTISSNVSGTAATGILTFDAAKLLITTFNQETFLLCLPIILQPRAE